MKSRINQVYITLIGDKYDVCIEREGKEARWYEIDRDNRCVLNKIVRVGNFNPFFKFWIDLVGFPTIFIDRIITDPRTPEQREQDILSKEWKETYQSLG